MAMIEENEMALSYNNLWKTLIDKGINKSELCRKVKISSSTMAKMTNGEPVTLTTLEKICDELDCKIEDVVEFISDSRKSNG